MLPLVVLTTAVITLDDQLALIYIDTGVPRLPTGVPAPGMMLALSAAQCYTVPMGRREVKRLCRPRDSRAHAGQSEPGHPLTD